MQLNFIYTLPRLWVLVSTVRICFSSISLTSNSLVSQASLLPSLPNFFLLEIASSCAQWKTSLKICQLCSAPLSLRAVSQGILLNISLKSWKSAFLKFRGLTLLLTWFTFFRTRVSDSLRHLPPSLQGYHYQESLLQSVPLNYTLNYIVRMYNLQSLLSILPATTDNREILYFDIQDDDREDLIFLDNTTTMWSSIFIILKTQSILCYCMMSILEIC